MAEKEAANSPERVQSLETELRNAKVSTGAAACSSHFLTHARSRGKFATSTCGSVSRSGEKRRFTNKYIRALLGVFEVHSCAAASND